MITPGYCGSNSTGYVPMTVTAAKNLTLGRAVAISGAAVDPNMSYHQSPSITALMTVFNARLGWWLQNPAKPDWRGDGPRCNHLFYSELFGWTNDLGEYVHFPTVAISRTWASTSWSAVAAATSSLSRPPPTAARPPTVSRS